MCVGPHRIVKVYSKLRHIRSFGFVLVFCFLLLTSCGSIQEVSRTDFMLDTFVTQYWQGENAQRCYEEIKAMLESYENTLSSYKEDSEIFKINENSGKKPLKVSDETFHILEISKELSCLTGGRFDITVSPLVRLWNITGEDPKVPALKDIEKARSLVSCEKLSLDKKDGTVFLEQENMGIDLGAVLKGYFAEKSLAVAKKYNVSGYISVGGNMAVNGRKSDGRDFIMGVRNPRGESSDYIGTLSMDGLTMATAGDYERSFMYEGKLYHHILDPFTGYPADTDIISATVLSEDGLLADFLSTYIFMEGTDSLDKFKGCDSFEFMAVDKDLNVYFSKGFKERFHPNENKKEFNFSA